MPVESTKSQKHHCDVPALPHGFCWWRAGSVVWRSLASTGGREGLDVHTWLFGLARPSPLRRTVRVDFARRDLSGKIAYPADLLANSEPLQGRIQPGVGGDAGNSRLAHKARAARARQRIYGEWHRGLGPSPSYRSGPQGHRRRARTPPWPAVRRCLGSSAQSTQAAVIPVLKEAKSLLSCRRGRGDRALARAYLDSRGGPRRLFRNQIKQ